MKMVNAKGTKRVPVPVLLSRLIVLRVVMGIAALSSSVGAAEGVPSSVYVSWTQYLEASPGSSNTGPLMAESDGKLYVLRVDGGVAGFKEYDIASNTWTDLATSNGGTEPSGGFTMVASDGKLYVLGYEPDLSADFLFQMEPSLHEYNIATSTWTDLSSPAGGTAPLARNNPGMAAANGRLYVFGGIDFIVPSNSLNQYDIASRTWTDLSSASAPSGRYMFGMAAIDGKLYVFGGFTSMSFAQDNAFFEFDITSGKWTDLSSDGNTIPTLASVGMTASGGKLYIFGGDDGTGEKNDLREYDIASGAWMDLSFPTFGDPPSVRVKSMMASFSGNVYVFGGQKIGGNFTKDDMHRYDVASSAWAHLSSVAGGTPPSDRDYMGLVSSNGKLYVFGGSSSLLNPPYSQVKNDLHEFDLESVRWTDLTAPAGGTAPSTRDSMAMAESDGKLYVFGGCNDDICLNDLHQFDIASATWTDLSLPFGGIAPSVRGFPHMAASGGKLYVFGGEIDWDNLLNDLHEYEIISRTWTELSYASGSMTPPYRRGVGMAAFGGKLYIFGGLGEQSTWNNDLHEYDIPSRTWTSLSIESATAPSVRHSVGMAAFDNKLCVFGGIGFLDYADRNDLYLYDIASGTWHDLSIPTGGTAPQSSEITLGMSASEGKLYLLTRGSSSLYEVYIEQLNECGGNDGTYNGCDSNAECTDTFGSFVCECKIGYEGDGKICTSGGAGSIVTIIIVVSACGGVLVAALALVVARRKRKGRVGNDGAPSIEERDEAVMKAFRNFVPQADGQDGNSAENKFVGHFIFGKSSASAGGLEAALGVSPNYLEGKTLVDIQKEWDKSGSEEDKANFHYVLSGKAGDVEHYPAHMKKQIETGVYHGGLLENPRSDIDFGHDNFTLDNFVKSQHAMLAKLSKEEVFCVRLYTTSSFPCFNKPLRMQTQPHPFALSVYFLDKALKKLRRVEAHLDVESFIQSTILYRGMKNMNLDEDEFQKQGGTELAPMSTTSDIQVAARYALSEAPLLFEYKARANAKGVSIQCFSVYPKEVEFLYPPLTLITPEGPSRTVSLKGGTRVKILTVTPQMS